MTDRDADAAALAGAMGWTFEIGPAFRPETDRVFWTRPRNGKGEAAEWIPIPAPDAPLGERLAFVGRLCEAMPHCELDTIERGYRNTVAYWCVTILRSEPKHSYHEAAELDLVHAAIRAAIEARRA